MTKEALRKLFLEKRSSLSQETYDKLNESLIDNFFKSIDFSTLSVLHSFLPIEKTKEPDTRKLIKRIKKQLPSVKIAIPKINTQTSNLDHFYFEGENQLEKNTWGIPEPKQGVPVPLEKIDAVIVPLLAFDKSGHRVGYGRGFYDKFLNQCTGRIQRIGISLFPPVDEIENVNLNDQRLTCAVTPDEVFVFD
ncbi:5-formyltetrahydrofolate cyclo-ligase [Chryseosolibacter indicus]|uniref:5-formyltetrahydrofolate cyclo-ligase n=1 Tax=Chryseosolibacter indicus TaxID=2782351 RepID=A0ABS5VME7_9BACT|nr:5-formyltetrahydrofolate cyclo-ligase [Chryseosolibacter indicus]MBT1702628.1 5-formyltetrahydrofolate cyclo-ligase [Chryseosolibacter indicus]